MIKTKNGTYYSLEELNEIFGNNFKIIDKDLFKKSCREAKLSLVRVVNTFCGPIKKIDGESEIETLARNHSFYSNEVIIYKILDKPNTPITYYQLSVFIGSGDDIGDIKKALRLQKLRAFL